MLTDIEETCYAKFIMEYELITLDKAGEEVEGFEKGYHKRSV